MNSIKELENKCENAKKKYEDSKIARENNPSKDIEKASQFAYAQYVEAKQDLIFHSLHYRFKN